mmetsp:Transcript_49682/g.137712  ORF Transcript_49682/g.137712 Transcript_49682/m.137712 type:complete len:232 (-) Transcript_49682:126-821(-)
MLAACGWRGGWRHADQASGWVRCVSAHCLLRGQRVRASHKGQASGQASRQGPAQGSVGGVRLGIRVRTRLGRLAEASAGRTAADGDAKHERLGVERREGGGSEPKDGRLGEGVSGAEEGGDEDDEWLERAVEERRDRPQQIDHRQGGHARADRAEAANDPNREAVLGEEEAVAYGHGEQRAVEDDVERELDVRARKRVVEVVDCGEDHICRQHRTKAEEQEAEVEPPRASG